MDKDIVEFVEEICGIRLLEYQKKMLIELHERGPNNVLAMCKDHGRTDLRMLTAVVNNIFGGDNNGSYSI